MERANLENEEYVLEKVQVLIKAAQSTEFLHCKCFAKHDNVTISSVGRLFQINARRIWLANLGLHIRLSTSNELLKLQELDRHLNVILQVILSIHVERLKSVKSAYIRRTLKQKG